MKLIDYVALTYADLKSSVLYTGTEKLFNDLTNLLLVLTPISVIGFVIYFAIRRGAADEMDQKTWNKRIMVAIVSGGIAMLASVIIKVVMSYYGVDINV